MKVRVNESGIRELERDEKVAEQLRKPAEKVLAKARRNAPPWLEADWFVRVGVSEKGAFSQAIARGSGTVVAEYGGSTSPAHGYMRSATR